MVKLWKSRAKNHGSCPALLNGDACYGAEDSGSTHLQDISQSASEENNNATDSLVVLTGTKNVASHRVADLSQSPPVIISSIVKFQKAPSLNAELLYKIPMTPINATFGIVTEEPQRAMELSRMVKQERRLVKSDITVVFAIRRPGCGACRDHGRQLSEFAKQHNVCLVGAIKHIHVDDAALIDFYKNYFRYPLYMDKNWDIFKALGARRISLWKLLSKGPKMEKRYRQKEITNIPFGGDIFTQGGVLILDRQGQLRYAHYENYGEELDLNEFQQVIEDIRSESSARSERLSSSFASSVQSTAQAWETTAFEYPLPLSSKA